MATRTITATPANKLRRGMKFMLARTECIVFTVEKNQFDHMIVHFAQTHDENIDSGFLVVPEDFPFDILPR